MEKCWLTKNNNLQIIKGKGVHKYEEKLQKPQSGLKNRPLTLQFSTLQLTANRKRKDRHSIIKPQTIYLSVSVISQFFLLTQTVEVTISPELHHNLFSAQQLPLNQEKLLNATGSSDLHSGTQQNTLKPSHFCIMVKKEMKSFRYQGEANLAQKYVFHVNIKIL